MKIRLSEWGSIADVVSGIAVVISLIYIAIEVRGNTRAQEAATIQAISAQGIALSKELPLEVRRKIRAGEELSPQEASEYGLFVFTALRVYESWWLQWQLGTLRDEVFSTYNAFIGSTFGDQYTRDIWTNGAFNFTPGFQAYLNQWLAEHRLPQ